jgi:hypothetical protein
MEGYAVVTSEEQTVGHVVGESDDNLIVEHGTLRKHKRPLPRALVEIDDDAKIVRTTVSKQIFEDAPECRDDVDLRAVADHYGLAGGDEAPPTLGYGEELPSDPARTADDDRISAGLPTADQERAEMLREETNPRHAQDAPASPGLLGGDRYRDAP